MNPAAIESHLLLLLIAWSVIIGAAWAVGRLGKKLGQPLAVGEIAEGILLGPSVLGLCGPWGAEAVAFLRDPELQSLNAVGWMGLAVVSVCSVAANSGVVISVPDSVEKLITTPSASAPCSILVRSWA